MYIIAGLGNPESKYDKTRHNIGFRLIDELAVRNGITFSDRKHNGLVGKGIISGEKVILLKPLTYMNLSGECVGPAADYYKVEPENVIILFDDISLDVGRIRIRKKGSAGGHNGIKALLRTLEVRTFHVLSLVSGISRRKWILPIMFSEDFHPRMRLRYPKELKGRARRLNA